MAIYSLKKSYLLKDLQETDFKDLWGDHGIFTTMWIFGKPARILFFENHIKNMIKSLKDYKIEKNSLKKDLPHQAEFIRPSQGKCIKIVL